MYKCLKPDFPDLLKKINHITKKLNRQGLSYNFSIIREYMEEVTVCIIKNNRITKRIKIIEEVVEYDFRMDNFKIGDYDILAVIDHRLAENLIYPFNGAVVPGKYRNVGGFCDHCNSNRDRAKTILIKDEAGNIKQVGTTCIDDFLGVEAEDVIAGYAKIMDQLVDLDREIVIDEDDYNSKKYGNCFNTKDYLAYCIFCINNFGYDKETKNEAAKLKNDGEIIDKKYYILADEVIKYFIDRQFSSEYLNNTRVLLSEEFCKVGGIIAYAYIAYKAEIEQQRKIENCEFYGNVGEKINLQLKLVDMLVFENNFAYKSFNYIYILEDEGNHVFKWSTNKNLGIDSGKCLRVTGTIKAHEDYKGKKQTALTRCKVEEVSA
jgi:hypothetical protein